MEKCSVNHQDFQIEDKMRSHFTPEFLSLGTDGILDWITMLKGLP